MILYLHSGENGTACTLPRCHAVLGFTIFLFFLAVYNGKFHTYTQVGRLSST